MPAPKGNKYAVGNKGGRVQEIDVEDMIERLDAYIEDTEEPMVIEFCTNYKISKTRFYELVRIHDDLAHSVKRLLTKEETFLVKNGERQKINPVFAMFRLKQPAFGYKDKQEVEQTNVNIDAATLSPEDREKRLAELKAKLMEE